MEDQEERIICFYKVPKVDWARPLCKLETFVTLGPGSLPVFQSRTSWCPWANQDSGSGTVRPLNAEVPQLIGREVALCANRMIIPAISEYVKVGLQAWNEGIVAAKDVQAVGQIKMTLILKLMQDVLQVAGDCCEHIMPQALNSDYKKN
ncbi:hypothetical protein SRHO_G00160140 [Serrasalmus rhombeus]